MARKKNIPGEVIGYRKDGRVIRLIAGGSSDVPPQGAPAPTLEVPPPAPPPVAQPVPQVVPPQNAPQADQNTRYFTAEEVERFRQQERDKLYPQLSELQQKLASFEEERQKVLQEQEEARKAQEEAARKAAEEEMTVRQLLQQKESEWEQRFAALEKEREFTALQAYIQRRVREESEGQTIAPELLDLVTGSSEEEVEASIARLREKTEAIVTNLQQAAQQYQQPAPPRGVTPAGYAATGPMEMQTEQREVTPEEIRQMSMAEYAEFRKNFRFGNSASGQGIFS